MIGNSGPLDRMVVGSPAAVEPSRDLLLRLTLAVGTAYLVFLLVSYVAVGATPGIEILPFVIGLVALFLGRHRLVAVEWLPLLLILVAWEAQRGVAAAVGPAASSDAIVDLERALTGGIIPSVAIQRALRLPGTVSVLDVVMSGVYVAHFAYPVAYAWWLWVNDRERYMRFVMALVAVSFAAFFTFLVLPVAPPRFASLASLPLPPVDVMSEVARSLLWSGPSWAYANLLGNPTAAFPSMHAAYPLLVFLFLRERSSRAALPWALFVVVIWFATIYLGHHYAIDVVAGAAYGWAAYSLTRIRWSRFRRWQLASVPIDVADRPDRLR